MDATQAENHTTILAIAPSPIDRNLIWVGTDDGNLQVTRDGGSSWTNVAARLPDYVEGSWIPQIVPSSYDAAEAFVVVNDYRRNNWQPYAYHTNDYGTTWTRIAKPGEIDDEAFVLSIVQDPIEPNLMFLGTDYGLYVTFNKGSNWQKYDIDLPSVQVADLKIHPREGDLIIGTFGRSIFILDDLTPLREICKSKEVLAQNLKLFDPPDAFLASYKSYDGMHFPADAEFMGENRRRGAMLTFWYTKQKKKKAMPAEAMASTDQETVVEKGRRAKRKTKNNVTKVVESKSIKEKPEEKKESTEESTRTASRGPGAMGSRGPNSDQISFSILSMEEDTIRTFKRPIKEGMNRIYWGLERNGPKFPNFGGNRRFRGNPGGPAVLPGIYKVVAEYGKFKDSTTIEVLIDPRADYSEKDLHAREDIIVEYTDLINQLSDGVKNITDAEETIKNVSTLMKSLPDSTQKDLKKHNGEMTKELNRLREIFTTPRDSKGIDGTPRLLRHVWMTSTYINSTLGQPGQNTINAYENTKEKITDALDQIKDFFMGDWATYQQEVQNHEFKLFKDFKEVKVN